MNGFDWIGASWHPWVVGGGLLVLFSLAIFGPRISVGRRAGKLGAEQVLAAENNMRATLFQAITALVLIFGAAITLYQVNDTANATRNQLQLTQQAQVSQQFTQAVSQLAPATSQPSQFGGIYGLARLAEQDHSYAPDVIRVLATFIRINAGPVGNRPDIVSMAVRKPSVQAALTALLTPPLSRLRGTTPVDLSTGFTTSQLNLRNADFTNADLEGVDLEGDAIDGSSFVDANLIRACLRNVDVVGTYFNGAHLEEADLEGAMGFGRTELGLYYDSHTLWPKIVNPASLGTLVSDSQHPVAGPCPS